jgi:hypothetical protein
MLGSDRPAMTEFIGPVGFQPVGAGLLYEHLLHQPKGTQA